MFIRKIGKTLRGKSTPYQLACACVLSSLIGFTPGFAQAPGLVVALVLLLVVLNANLFIAAIVGSLAKLASMALAPVSFAIGRALLEGPTEGLFRAMVNAPVLAFFGFDYYLTPGAMVVGLLFGIGASVLVIGTIRSFRARMAKMEKDSERFRAFSSKRSVRFLTWLLFGKGHGKLTYEDLLQKKIGKPFRPLGVVFAALVVALLFVTRMFLTEPIVTAALQRGLERTNGATVDLTRADLNLSAGSLTIEGLAMADPEALESDLLRAARVEAQISGRDLLRKRLAIEQITLIDASSGEARRVRGVHVGPRPRPADPPDPGANEKTIDDYLKDAALWRERLAQAQRWLNELNRRRPTEKDPGVPPDQRAETWRERIEREVREKGYANVRAGHLVDGAPMLLVRRIVAEGASAKQLEGEVVDLRIENASTQPWLVPEPPRISVRTRSERLLVEATLGHDPSVPDGRGPFNVSLKGMSADAIGEQLASIAGRPPIQGGTMDVDLRGRWAAKGVGYLDHDMTVSLRDTTLTTGGGSHPVANFVLPIHLRGSIAAPLIGINPERLAKSLVDAGAGELAAKAQREAEKQVDKALDKVGGEAAERARGIVGGLLGGEKDKDKK